MLYVSMSSRTWTSLGYSLFVAMPSIFTVSTRGFSPTLLVLSADDHSQPQTSASTKRRLLSSPSQGFIMSTKAKLLSRKESSLFVSGDSKIKVRVKANGMKLKAKLVWECQEGATRWARISISNAIKILWWLCFRGKNR